MTNRNRRQHKQNHKKQKQQTNEKALSQQKIVAPVNPDQGRSVKNKRGHLTSQRSPNETTRFNEQLASLSLSLYDIKGDGNCLFRALSHQYLGDEEHHAKIRSEVIAYVRKHQEFFKMFVEDDNTIEKHIDRMSKLGTYGGNMEVVAFARINNVDIFIHQLGQNPYQIAAGNAAHSKPLHIIYHSWEHYSSTQPADASASSSGAKTIKAAKSRASFLENAANVRAKRDRAMKDLLSVACNVPLMDPWDEEVHTSKTKFFNTEPSNSSVCNMPDTIKVGSDLRRWKSGTITNCLRFACNFPLTDNWEEEEDVTESNNNPVSQLNDSVDRLALSVSTSLSATIWEQDSAEAKTELAAACSSITNHENDFVGQKKKSKYLLSHPGHVRAADRKRIAKERQKLNRLLKVIGQPNNLKNANPMETAQPAPVLKPTLI